MFGPPAGVIALVFAAVVVPTATAIAASYTIDFTGSVVVISDSLVGGSLQVGAPVRGHLVVRSDGLVDIEPNPALGFYRDAVSSFELSVADYHVMETTPNLFDPNDYVYVHDDCCGVPPTDGFAARSPVLGDPVNGLGPMLAQFALETSPVFPRDNIQGDAIPTLAELNRWQGDLHAAGALNFLIFSGDENRIDWVLESYSVVPEPDGAILGLAAAAIASLTRLRHTNRWRQRSSPRSRRR